jgi:selenocysteine lyase/cysteine desulfurase
MVGLRLVESNDGGDDTFERMMQLYQYMQEHQLYVAVRCGALRVSPYLDTQPGDIERLVQVLKDYPPFRYMGRVD